MRTSFFATGLFVWLWGASLFFVDKVTLNARAETGKPARVVKVISSVRSDGQREIDLPGWLPYTLVGIGGVTMLYSVALPRH